MSGGAIRRSFRSSSLSPALTATLISDIRLLLAWCAACSCTSHDTRRLTQYAVYGMVFKRVSGASACWWPCARYGLRRTIYVSWFTLRQGPFALGLSIGFLIANTLPKRTTCPNRRERRRATSCASSSSGSSACRRYGSLSTRCESKSCIASRLEFSTSCPIFTAIPARSHGLPYSQVHRI